MPEQHEDWTRELDRRGRPRRAAIHRLQRVIVLFERDAKQVKNYFPTQSTGVWIGAESCQCRDGEPVNWDHFAPDQSDEIICRRVCHWSKQHPFEIFRRRTLCTQRQAEDSICEET
jgi:hypothetical protein